MNRLGKFLTTGAILVLVAGGIAIAHPGHPPIPPPKVAVTARSSAMQFELFRGQRIMLEGSINGVPTEILLDSGAGMTVVDRAFAERIGIKGTQPIDVQGAGGKVPGMIAGGVTLETGGLRLTALNVLVLDMADVARGVGHPISVVLGREAFKAAAVTLDFPGRTIRFTDRTDFRPPAGSVKVPLGENAALPNLKVSVAGLEPIDAHLDLGNHGTLILAKSYWQSQPKLAALPYAETQMGGVGGLKLARRVTLPAVEFGGMRFENIPATLAEDSTAMPVGGGNVGLELLKTAVVTVDFVGGALYLQPTGAAGSIWRDRAGARAELVGDRLRVVYVSPQGPAAKSGLKAGDEIVAVDGRTVDSNYYDGPDWIGLEAGRSITLKRADGSEVVVTLADYY